MTVAAGLRWLATAALAAGCATMASDDYASVPPWPTRAVPEARGEVRTLPDGKRQAVRYAGWPRTDYGRFRTYAYTDTRADIPIQRAPMPGGITADATKG